MEKYSVFYFSLVLLFLTFSGFSQSITPEVVATTGHHADGQGFSLSWTVGEVAIQSFFTPDYILTEGFHQPEIRTVNLLPDVDAGLSLFPNPASHTFWIQKTPANQEKISRVEGYDMLGRRVFSKHLQGSLTREGVEIPSAIDAGVYLIMLFDTEDRVLLSNKLSIYSHP